MSPGSHRLLGARPLYWLMLALAIGGSFGLRVMAVRAHAYDDWQPAVYRFRADGMPDCTDLTGHAVGVVATAGSDRWSRLALPKLAGSKPLPSLLRGCLLRDQPPT